MAMRWRIVDFICIVTPTLVAGIHVLNSASNKDVDGRNKSGDDELSISN
jgi:hypothetical protein